MTREGSGVRGNGGYSIDVVGSRDCGGFSRVGGGGCANVGCVDVVGGSWWV